jgi:4-hydroxybenzoate polyprenyltransferase
MFLMGAWTSRSAGCIINDYFDRDFDRSVERTKLRPLASGEVTVREAMGVLVANLMGGLYVLTQLPLPALVATFGILPVAALYPLAKRYTRYPQFVLGLAFNSGVIIGALTVAPTNFAWLPTLLMYGAGVSWTLVYDTVYAFQDISDDKKLGLKSTAITW